MAERPGTAGKTPGTAKTAAGTPAGTPPTTPNAIETICEARGVSHDFILPNGRPHRVLEGIDLKIHPNEVVALLGPSGCGKSTILRILAGLIQPTHGEVFYRGEPLRTLSPGVAIVFQSFALYPWMTVLENVQVVLRAAGLPPPEIQARSEETVRKVGLAGFEEAYPRELSGGMKQRVGMARALAVNPELLFMDEPFSQVDALTAESLRAEVIDIWAEADRNPESVLMVSHDIKEVVYMADRIVVLAANPGRIAQVIENRVPRPRDYRSAESLALVDRLHEIITGQELPDLPEAVAAAPAAPSGAAPSAGAPAGGPEAAPYEALPAATTSEIVGVLEYLDSRGGRAEIFRMAAETQHEFGRLITVIEAAEMLNLVDTPKREVVLDVEGIRFLKAAPEERKEIWREQLLRLRIFREVKEMLEGAGGGSIDAEDVTDFISTVLPNENYEETFETFVRWARFGNLFAYDEARRRLSLQ